MPRDPTVYYESAFPITNETRSNGMELRDWFAGRAISALLLGRGPGSFSDFDDARIQRVVKESYAVADAMMKERMK